MIHRQELASVFPPPPMVSTEQAVAPCGCMLLVGMRVDTMEPATAAIPCSAEHDQMMTEYNLRLKETLAEPTDEPMVQLGDRMLTKIYEERVSGAA